jgi:cytochrome c-type biogenesis protein CcmH
MKKAAEILLLCLAIALLMGADKPDERFHRLGSKIMCTCGDCTYMLLECNHVGCPNSTRMIAELHALTGSGTGQAAVAAANLKLEDNDEAVLNWFRKTWGVTAVVEPATHGLELWAWILPPAALALGLALAIIVVYKWRARQVRQPAAVPPNPHLDALRARARRETEI